MTNNIISYIDMCRREGASLQQGMDFGLGGNHSVIDPLPRRRAGRTHHPHRPYRQARARAVPRHPPGPPLSNRTAPPLTVPERLRDVVRYRDVQPVTSDSSDPSARAS